MHHHIGIALPTAAHHQNPPLPTMALLCHGLGASCGARCLHMLPLIIAHRSNSSREIGQVPLKEPLRASLVKHEEPWVCWENRKPSDWPNVAQAPSFLIPSSATHNAHNTYTPTIMANGWQGAIRMVSETPPTNTHGDFHLLRKATWWSSIFTFCSSPTCTFWSLRMCKKRYEIEILKLL